MDQLEGWVTTGEATSISGYTRLTLSIKALKGEIQQIKVGRTVLYRRDEMEELAREREAKQQGGQNE